MKFAELDADVQEKLLESSLCLCKRSAAIENAGDIVDAIRLSAVSEIKDRLDMLNGYELCSVKAWFEFCTANMEADEAGRFASNALEC